MVVETLTVIETTIVMDSPIVIDSPMTMETHSYLMMLILNPTFGINLTTLIMKI